MYYDPSNPATFGPNTSIAYGGLPQPVEPAVPAAPAAPAPQLQQPAMPAAPAMPATPAPAAVTPPLLGSAMQDKTGRKRQGWYQKRLEDFARHVDRGRTTFNPQHAQRLFQGAPFMAGLQPFDNNAVQRANPLQFNQARNDWNNQFIQAFNTYRQATPDWMSQLGAAYYAGLPEGHRTGLPAAPPVAPPSQPPVVEHVRRTGLLGPSMRKA